MGPRLPGDPDPRRIATTHHRSNYLESSPHMPTPLPHGKKLAVPPMHPGIPAEIVDQVHDYVQRRMFVEAVNLAADSEYDRKRLQRNQRNTDGLTELAEQEAGNGGQDTLSLPGHLSLSRAIAAPHRAIHAA